jgi:calcineurin-like phosphoesterase family protein
MKIAIFSDVHSNLPALEAVLKRQGISMQVCLGDIVGYNAEPAEYSRAHLSAEQKQYLRDLPLLKTTDCWTYVHASLAEPSERYYVDSPREALLHFEHSERQWLFVATHIGRSCGSGTKAESSPPNSHAQSWH